MADYPYVWRWHAGPTGQRCRIVERPTRCTVTLEFPDGTRRTASNYAVRRARKKTEAAYA